jgi:protein SCO1/2
VTRALALGAAARAVAPGTPTRTDLDISAFALTDQSGQRTSFAEFRGRTVLLTFAYGHCATVCPMVVHDVLAARRTANRPELPLLIVTLDPWRDAPDRLSSLAEKWDLAPGDRVLSGSIAEVQQTLDALGIGRRRDETTGDIEHGGTVMIVDARGHVAWRLDGGWGRLGELLGRQPAS